VHAEGERVFLHRSGEEREEVELTRPPSSPTPAAVKEQGETLPEPLCPDGSPTEPTGEPAVRPPLAPGQSGLDGAFGASMPQREIDRDFDSPLNNDAQDEGGQS
jgi:hypothetical protein